MEAAIDAVPKERIHDLYTALMELCEEDPLIKVWKDDVHNELYIRLFGQVQKEVIETTLLRNIICRLLFQIRELYVWRSQLALGFPLK